VPEITIDTIVQDVRAGIAAEDKGAVFQKIYQDIADLQKQDGGAGSARFQDDLHALNEKLHAENILPGLEIRGIEEGREPIPGRRFDFGKADTILLSDGTPKQAPEAENVLAVNKWYPELAGTPSPTQQRLLDVSKDSLGQQLWETRHPSPGLADSPDPPGPPHYGGAGGYGCAPSVSEALRRANILSPEEDPLNVQDVQTILEDSHGWKPILDSTNDPESTPSLEELVLEPGDVICGYRKGESHSGAGAHVGIVGEDGKVYNHGLAPDPNNPGQKHEEWTQGDITRWIKEEYTDGIVVLRAPDAV